MKKLIFILTIGSLVAQYLPPQSEIDNMTTTSKMLLYEMKKLSRIESFFDSEIGLNSKQGKKILLIGSALSYSPFIIGLITNKSSQAHGSIAYFGSIWTVIWNFKNTEKQRGIYNNNLYRKIFGEEPPSFSLNLQPTYNGANLTMTYSFN